MNPCCTYEITGMVFAGEWVPEEWYCVAVVLWARCCS